MKILAIVNTSYQVIIAVHLRKKMFMNAEMDVIVTDQVPKGEQIAKRAEETGLFDRVFYVCDKSNLNNTTALGKIADIIQFSLGAGKHFNVNSPCPEMQYDTLLYYNFDLLAIKLFDECVKNNPQIKLCHFEEGFLSYNSEITASGKNSRKAWILRLRKALRIKKNWEPYFDRYYCFFPWLIDRETGYTLEQIPTIEAHDDETVRLLNHIFAYEPDPEEYNARIIYFEGWFECGEKNIVRQIAAAVGKENVVVKPHPRHQNDWAKTVGVRTSTNNHVPWEIIQMNLDLSDSVLVAVSSSCLAVASAILREDIPALYLFPCVKPQGTQNDKIVFTDVTETLTSALKKLQSRDLLPRVKIVKDEAQLQDELSAL